MLEQKLKKNGKHDSRTVWWNIKTSYTLISTLLSQPVAKWLLVWLIIVDRCSCLQVLADPGYLSYVVKWYKINCMLSFTSHFSYYARQLECRCMKTWKSITKHSTKPHQLSVNTTQCNESIWTLMQEVNEETHFTFSQN